MRIKINIENIGGAYVQNFSRNIFILEVTVKISLSKTKTNSLTNIFAATEKLMIIRIGGYH